MEHEEYLDWLGQRLQTRGYECRGQFTPGPEPVLVARRAGFEPGRLNFVETVFVVAFLEAPTRVGLERFAKAACQRAGADPCPLATVSCFPLALSNSLGADVRATLETRREWAGFPVVRLATGELIFYQGPGWGCAWMRRRALEELQAPP